MKDYLQLDPMTRKDFKNNLFEWDNDLYYEVEEW